MPTEIKVWEIGEGEPGRRLRSGYEGASEYAMPAGELIL